MTYDNELKKEIKKLKEWIKVVELFVLLFLMFVLLMGLLFYKNHQCIVTGVDCYNMSEWIKT